MIATSYTNYGCRIYNRILRSPNGRLFFSVCCALSLHAAAGWALLRFFPAADGSAYVRTEPSVLSVVLLQPARASARTEEAPAGLPPAVEPSRSSEAPTHAPENSPPRQSDPSPPEKTPSSETDAERSVDTPRKHEPDGNGAGAEAPSGEPPESGTGKGGDPETAAPELANVRIEPVLLGELRPAYPVSARRKKQEGTVLLYAMISIEGVPYACEIYRSSGFEVLDRAALEALRQSRFSPGTRDGIPEAAEVTVSVTFRLEG